ncbi:MAG: HlyC/CorC family transporter [Gemmatimonadetes bacterium]|nr:MAG: HlyC/CorC family transporter [Gemmatimonadota bacterium]
MTPAVIASTVRSRRRLSARNGARCVHWTSIGSVALTGFSSSSSHNNVPVPPPGNTPYVPASMPDPASESLGFRLLAVVMLVLANAFFVAAEFALVAARRTRIEAMVRRGDRRARTVQTALQDLYRQLSAAQLGITVASILLGYVAEDTVAHLFRDWFAALPSALQFLTRGGVASTVAVAVVSFLHVVFGEQAPKAWAITHPERTSRWIAAPLIFFSRITRPFTDLLNWSAHRVVRLLGLRGTTAELERIHSPEEIRMLVKQSQERGKLDADDALLLQGVFEFSEKSAREVMTPRTEMVALPVDLTLEEAADQVAVAGRSRYPVYGESLDDILGVVHAKDILAGLRSLKGGGLRAVLRPAMFVPGTREVEDVLADMKRQKIHLAIVLDEFGGTAGLVTMEDLLEEIVGQIYDEYDRPSGDSRPTPPAGTAPVITGSTPIREVNVAFGLELDEQDYTTIGGFLFGALGRLPKPGDQVAVKGALFEIVEMEGRRVGAVRVVRRAATGSEA